MIVYGRPTDTNSHHVSSGESRGGSNSEQVSSTTSTIVTSNSISITISHNSDSGLPSFSGGEASRIFVTTCTSTTIVCTSEAESNGNENECINAYPNRRSACLGLGL